VAVESTRATHPFSTVHKFSYLQRCCPNRSVSSGNSARTLSVVDYDGSAHDQTEYRRYSQIRCI
jgi:hypothetical protein